MSDDPHDHEISVESRATLRGGDDPAPGPRRIAPVATLDCDTAIDGRGRADVWYLHAKALRSREPS